MKHNSSLYDIPLSEVLDYLIYDDIIELSRAIRYPKYLKRLIYLGLKIQI